MFFMRRSGRLALGFALGSLTALAVVGTAMGCYPPTRMMAEKLYRKYRRRLAKLDLLP